ncbi:MAG: hypothetical protein Q8K63_13710, partial [Acidimicrobiales bacterium]|nr:hypothetical protein [Acidimicrobiales bacterium]
MKDAEAVVVRQHLEQLREFCCRRVGHDVAAFGGAGDAAWHSAYGVERGVDALLSPTHLVLFAGLILILTAPVRAILAAATSAPYRWIVVGSVTSAAALVGFFLNFAWGLGVAVLIRVPYNPVSEVGETEVIAGVASMLVTTVVLFGAARVVLSVGSPPTLAFTVLFGAVALLVSVAFDEDAEGVVAAVAAGAIFDVLQRRVERKGNLPSDLAAVFGVVSAGLWLVYLGLLSALDGIEWRAEIWLGAVVLNGLAAYAVASM